MSSGQVFLYLAFACAPQPTPASSGDFKPFLSFALLKSFANLLMSVEVGECFQFTAAGVGEIGFGGTL